MTDDPQDWQPVRIEEIGEVVTGKTPPTSRGELYGDKYPFITPSEIPDGHPRASTTRFLSEQGRLYQHRYMLPRNTVCYTCIASIGKACITVEPSFTNQQINSIIVDSGKYDHRFIYYLLRHETERIKRLASGTATPIINKSAFSEIELSVPSLSVQRKVGTILSAYDDLIANNTRRMAILEEMAQRLYREWFVHFRFPGHEGVEMIDSELGAIPEGWEVLQVNDIVKRLRPGKRYKQKEVADDGKVQVISQSQERVMGWHDGEPEHQATPEEPIILFGDHTCKMVLMTKPFSIAENVIPFVSRDDAPVTYLYHLTRGLIQTREYKRHWTPFKNKTVVRAPIEHADRFTRVVQPFHEHIDVLSERNRILRQARDLLLPRLVSGELNVADLAVDVKSLATQSRHVT